jgi:UDP-N-acetyl-2-amino-2-deoxyglucuronate dehydrogenase
MIQFALIGCGLIAERHVNEINRIGKLAAVCEVDKSKAAAFTQQTGANIYTDLDSLLEGEPGVEVVVVCTPNGLHAEHAIKSLQARRHVLCEKPLCIAAAAAWTMRDTAHFFRRKLFVVKQARFNPPVQQAKKALEQNSLGKILSFSINGYWNRPQDYYSGNWRGSTKLDGGILYTQFSHFIDLLLWMLGDVDIMKAMAQNSGLRTHFEIEDTFVAVLRLQSGALGTMHFSINSLPDSKEGSFTIIGEKGTLRIGGQYLNTLEWTPEAAHRDFEDKPARENDHGFYKGSMSNHHFVYNELAKALQGMPHQLPQVQESARTIELIEKLYAAARN